MNLTFFAKSLGIGTCGLYEGGKLFTGNEAIS
jgi:hypothetical protein